MAGELNKRLEAKKEKAGLPISVFIQVLSPPPSTCCLDATVIKKCLVFIQISKYPKSSVSQVNTSGEANKNGLEPKEAVAAADFIQQR